MSLVNSLRAEAASAGTLSGIDEVAVRQGLFESWRDQGLADAPSGEVPGQDRLAFWLSAQVHALYLDQPDARQPATGAQTSACAAPERCRYCQQEFDLLHKRAALLVLGRSGLLEG